MDQKEFNATQRINDACYDLIRDGYTIKEVYTALSTVMDAVQSKPAKDKATIKLNIDTTQARHELSQLQAQAQRLRHDLQC